MLDAYNPDRQVRPRLWTANVAIIATVLAGSPSATAAKSVARSSQTGNYIEYALPITTAKLTADMVLLSCTGGVPQAKMTVTVVPVSNPNPLPQQRFRLHGSNFASFWKNRSFDVELHPNGALKSINGGAADRTGAIISNVLKIGTGLVGLFGSPPPANSTEPKCNAETLKKLAEADKLKERIGILRASLASAPTGKADSTRKEIDALAGELARLRSEELHLSLEREIPFHEGVPVRGSAVRSGKGRLFWTGNELKKWMDSNGEATVPTFSLGYCADVSAEITASPGASCSEVLIEAAARAAPPLPTTQGAEGAQRSTESTIKSAQPTCWQADMLASCPRTIVTREPVPATLLIIATSDKIKGGKDSKLASKDLLISQWGSMNETRLDVGFGGNMTFKAGFDEFGRKSSLSWKSDSRGETITGALAGAVDGANAFRNALTTDLERQQAEITDLETRQKLNKLRFCREVIEAGGYTCPTG